MHLHFFLDVVWILLTSSGLLCAEHNVANLNKCTCIFSGCIWNTFDKFWASVNKGGVHCGFSAGGVTSRPKRDTPGSHEHPSFQERARPRAFRRNCSPGLPEHGVWESNLTLRGVILGTLIALLFTLVPVWFRTRLRRAVFCGRAGPIRAFTASWLGQCGLSLLVGWANWRFHC